MIKKKIDKSFAEQHVDWLLKIIRPLLITQFEHGYKHGHVQGQQQIMEKKEVI